LLDAASSLSNYSRSEFEPRLACAGLAGFREKDLVRIEARVVPAAAEVPEHCRVSGVLSPEIAFEVNLPARWNGRFYMIGNGGHAGEGFDDPLRAGLRSDASAAGFAMAMTKTGHDSPQGAAGVVRHEQPAEGDRLRTARST
jgi:feruloyl esterase